MLALRTSGLTKRYGDTVAVDAADLEVEAGELFFLLGPSGCGKTTLLRLIAGLTLPSAGSIYFGEREVAQVPANRREAAMVFQGYALWPHMTVAQNVAFGLKVRRRPDAEVRRRVRQALATVQLEGLEQRKPNELSGGQQQRVALARALVVEPRVLLLDEPLSNLDAQLRLQMRGQIRQICKAAGITSIYVTHDQKEALSIADRVAVMQRGRVAQVGTPQQLYRRPASRFVAEFMGEGVLLPATVLHRQGDDLRLRTPLGVLFSAGFADECAVGQSVTCCLRPECIELRENQPNVPLQGNEWVAEVAAATYLGEAARLELRTAQTNVVAWQTNPQTLPAVGWRVRAAVKAHDVIVLTK